MRVLSLGGGVQSSALALMLDRGFLDCETPDVAIWADTGNDPPEVAAMVAWLAGEVSYEVVVVRAAVDILHGLAQGTDARGNEVGCPVPTLTPATRTAARASRGVSAPTSGSCGRYGARYGTVSGSSQGGGFLLV